MQKISSSASFADSKPHYDLLDGLRGVAALLVVWYHVFEGYAFAGGTSIETINHGYLAVDFFFTLCIKYSLNPSNFSDARLNLMETSSTFTITFFSILTPTNQR